VKEPQTKLVAKMPEKKAAKATLRRTLDQRRKAAKGSLKAQMTGAVAASKPHAKPAVWLPKKVSRVSLVVRAKPCQGLTKPQEK
jgi:hypothetical protein